MPQHAGLLILLADGEDAGFVWPDRNHVLCTERVLDSVSAHRHPAELCTDRPGAAYGGESSAHHATAPRHDPRELEQWEFAQLLTNQINSAAEYGEFRELVIVAPRHILATIRDNPDATSASRIVGLPTKDLAKTPDTEPRSHLERWIGPSRRVRA